MILGIRQAEQRKKNALHDCINELQRCKRNIFTKHKNEYGAFVLEEKTAAENEYC